MTLFGLLWAALLPHQFYLSNSTALQWAKPSVAAHVQREPAVDSSASTHSLLNLQALADQPPALQPLLAWPETAVIDWPRWSATAAVAVVAQGDYVNGDVPQISSSSGFCSDYSAVGPDDPSTGFTIQVNNVPIGQVSSRRAADRIANQIRRAVPVLEAHPDRLTPSLSQHQAAAQVNGKTVFVLPNVGQGGGAAEHQPPALKATQWVNNLRLAFGVTPLEPSRVQMVAHGLGETRQTFNGTASWYGPYFHGRQTATGEIFNQNDLTAAHKTLPFGTYLKVRNQLNGKSVVVRINDRGPYIGDRSLDLSYAAAQCLGSTQPGVIPYEATILAPGVPYAWRSDVVAALP